jgi:hypothetical protein
MSNLIPVDAIAQMAVSVANSGLFGVKNADQAMALMLIAQAEGMHPAIAARDYHVINGRATLKADAMLARFHTAGGSVQWKTYTDEAVVAVLSHPQGGSVEVEWTLKMADKAGLTRNPTWRQYPRQMLRARVISEGIRTVFPGVAVGTYTPEEAADFDSKPARQVFDVQTIETPPAPSADIQRVISAIRAANTLEELNVAKQLVRAIPKEQRDPAIQAGLRRKGELEAQIVEIVPEVVQENAE